MTLLALRRPQQMLLRRVDPGRLARLPVVPVRRLGTVVPLLLPLARRALLRGLGQPLGPVLLLPGLVRGTRFTRGLVLPRDAFQLIPHTAPQILGGPELVQMAHARRDLLDLRRLPRAHAEQGPADRLRVDQRSMIPREPGALTYTARQGLDAGRVEELGARRRLAFFFHQATHLVLEGTRRLAPPPQALHAHRQQVDLLLLLQAIEGQFQQPIFFAFFLLRYSFSTALPHPPARHAAPLRAFDDQRRVLAHLSHALLPLPRLLHQTSSNPFATDHAPSSSLDE
mmetsp:Transcript_9609/g.29902  ORF Transcript_9609/g.29902 Transcript_9609/m.29902 type:complete len:284 (+) Transcript_9609:2-853(+)